MSKSIHSSINRNKSSRYFIPQPFIYVWEFEALLKLNSELITLSAYETHLKTWLNMVRQD
jgi:hypothetical protein